MRPWRAVDTAVTLNLGPFADTVGSGHHYVRSDSRLKRDGFARKAALFDIDFFTIHPVVDYYRIPGFCEQGGFADCPELVCLSNRGKFLSRYVQRPAIRIETQGKTHHKYARDFYPA